LRRHPDEGAAVNPDFASDEVQHERSRCAGVRVLMSRGRAKGCSAPEVARDRIPGHPRMARLQGRGHALHTQAQICKPPFFGWQPDRRPRGQSRITPTISKTTKSVAVQDNSRPK
jgi:hypothetical protein